MSRDSGMTDARLTEKEELAKDVAAVTYGGKPWVVHTPRSGD